ASLTVTTDDQSNFGVGGPRSATSGVSITVIDPNAAITDLSLSADPIDENGSTTLSGSFDDPAPQDTHVVLIDWGDGSVDTTLSLDPGVLTFGASHRYRDNRPGDAPYSVSAAVTDKDGESGDGSTSVTVLDVAPSAVSLIASPDTI